METNYRQVPLTEASYRHEAEAICRKGWQGQIAVVRLGEILFFSAPPKEAWMLEPAGRHCARLLENGNLLPIPIVESANKFLVRWSGRYEIKGAAFVVTEELGPPQTFVGYPTVEIERLSGEGDPQER